MQTSILDEYREQLRTCAQNLAVAKNDAVKPFLPSEDLAAMVKEFTAGNLDKRFGKLNDQFEFMAEEFPELEDWLVEYVKTVPLQAYDVGTTDSIEFLSWVREHKSLSPEQLDFVVCHESRVAVEEAARKNRMAHIWFQDVLSNSEERAGEFGTNPALWIHLNPIHVWATFRTDVLIGDDADLPATVVFFPHGSDIRTAVLERDGATLISKLEDLGPLRLEQLLVVLDGELQLERADLIATGRDLAEMGLIAFG